MLDIDVFIEKIKKKSRLIGIDPGGKRIGVAISDENKIVATPFSTIVKNKYSVFIKDIKKIYLTASGGPFLNYKFKNLKKIKPKEALKHPKWKMGKKISIDSSTLMNKLLELIEAQKLFEIPKKKLDILIHPESLVHAILELKNGLLKFIYHETSMIIPLANAIFDDSIEIKDFLKVKNKNQISIKIVIFRKSVKITFWDGLGPILDPDLNSA